MEVRIAGTNNCEAMKKAPKRVIDTTTETLSFGGDFHTIAWCVEFVSKGSNTLNGTGDRCFDI